MAVFIAALVRYWYVVVITILTVACVLIYSHWNTKYLEAKEELIQYKQDVLDSAILAKEHQDKVQQELYEKHNAQVIELANEIKNVHTTYTANRNELNSLHQALGSNKDNLSSASTTSLVNYSSTLSNLLGECSGMVTEIAARADEATATAVAQNKMMWSQKEMLDKLNADLTKNSDSVEQVLLK